VALTLDDLAQCHERAGLKYRRVAERNSIESDHSAFNGVYHVVWRVVGDLLTVNVPNVDKVPDQAQLPCLEALLAVNYSLLIGRFAYDPRDGEVCFRAGLSLANGTLTQQQFEHLLSAALGSADTYSAALKEIVWAKARPQDAIAHAEQARQAHFAALSGRTSV
jgi:hypothetical protein